MTNAVNVPDGQISSRKETRNSRVNLVGQNSEQGKEILLDIPKEMEGLDSIFLISNDGRWFPKSAAIWRVCRQLAFPWSLASTMFLVPWPIRDSSTMLMQE